METLILPEDFAFPFFFTPEERGWVVWGMAIGEFRVNLLAKISSPFDPFPRPIDILNLRDLIAAEDVLREEFNALFTERERIRVVRGIKACRTRVQMLGQISTL